MLGSLHSARAAPPGQNHAPGQTHSELRAPLDLRARLDLRAPLDLQPPIPESPKHEAFPSAARRSLFGGLQADQPAESSEPVESRMSGPGAAAARTPGRAEEFARRIHREGLPLARLWQNKSASLNLGLNQKGKPGLWLVQKVH
jgi:hypothetical protein